MHAGLEHDVQSPPANDEVATTKIDSEPPKLNSIPWTDVSISNDTQSDSHNEGRPVKKRKIADPFTQRSSSRPLSPPWRRVEVKGPTSFLQDGKRKSARTNAVPLDLRPQGNKRTTRAAVQNITPRKSMASIPTQTPTMASPTLNKDGQPRKKLGRPRKHPAADEAQPTTDSALKLQLQNGVAERSSPASGTPAKRSHKKQYRPVTSNHTSRKDNSTSSHTTRKVGRPPKVKASEADNRVPTTNGWYGSDDFQSKGGEGEEEEDEDEDIQDAPIDPNFKIQRVKFKLSMPTISLQSPSHILRPKKYSSFRDWVDSPDALVGDDVKRLTDTQVRKEARLRLRMIEAATAPGGVLTPDKCSSFQVEAQEEPPRQYGHQDHLVAHAVYFRKLMNNEHKQHMVKAKKIAQAAAEMWKRSQPKSPEEVVQEQTELNRLRYVQLIRDLVERWGMARAVVNQQRLERHEQEELARQKQEVIKVVEDSKRKFEKRRRRDSADISMMGDHTEDSDDDDHTEEDKDESDDDDEDNMSTSQSESEDDPRTNIRDDDEYLTVDELRRKYANVPGIPTEDLDRPPDGDLEDETIAIDAEAEPISESILESCPAGTWSPRKTVQEHDLASVPLDEVAKELLDDSEESTDMDGDMGSSEDNSDDEDDEDDDEDESEGEESQGLLGFLSKKELKDVTKQVDAAERTPASPELSDADAFDEEIEEVSLIPDATQVQTPSASNSEAPSLDVNKESKLGTGCTTHELIETEEKHHDLNSHLNQIKPSPLVQLSSPDNDTNVRQGSLPATPVSTQALRTRVPGLLRGTLREYQHYGLDWLAGLYANGTNGILADEMGLGKTIQTIALLAHLAVEHEIWGPHLVVVPTSVMLNWEMEFKKFLPGFKVLTYYGTIDERKAKRRGWQDQERWNVVITSYQLVLADAVVFKRRPWHYLVLDEAHNIKNFRSQRWQTLLTFRTQARLLLTGTPLQNNLTELWSLMFFLMPTDENDGESTGFAGLQDFTSWFKKPVDQIMEQGRDTMDDEARALVSQLHKILRPYLLRRLKADVEKQMPGKYEHVVYCKLSKRQRYLYDGFLSRADTKNILQNGNYMSIMNCLMQLRKVCNHPDLFETRQIVTSFAMERSTIADYEIKELLVRRRLLQEDPMGKVDLDGVNLVPGANDVVSPLDTIQNCRLAALFRFKRLETQQSGRIFPGMPYDGRSVDSTLASMENNARTSVLVRLNSCAYLTSLRSQRRPLYSHSLMERLRINLKLLPVAPRPTQRPLIGNWLSSGSPIMEDIVLTLTRRSELLKPLVTRFACVTPAVVATDMSLLALSQPVVSTICEAGIKQLEDPFHEARMRLSIAFPDKRLLQYDCGKLQRLEALLRTLQAGGHRALIFTQMTKVLDILEQFLNIHGYRYLRLDGSTKIEQRQILTDRFNNDDRILVFILSSRSGGIGINLTGADTVIFYDLDWNPAMDKQCQDRCHRIGQTRDVHIYRFVSEYTIEANILRKANQKRLLDDVVIQEGDFTTDYFNKPHIKDAFDDTESLRDGNEEASAAIDRVLGAGPGKISGQIFEQVEDKEDIAAAKEAEKEMTHVDDADFEEKTRSSGPATRLPTPGATVPPSTIVTMSDGLERTTTLEATQSGLVDDSAVNIGLLGADEEWAETPSADEYILRYLEWELKDVPFLPAGDKKQNKKKGAEHVVKRAR
ncbi:MAG: swr1 complex component [Icmadophila ericetorum]|nr:swr1 complex component [Icmadophila ericetorum]